MGDDGKLVPIADSEHAYDDGGRPLAPEAVKDYDISRSLAVSRRLNDLRRGE